MRTISPGEENTAHLQQDPKMWTSLISFNNNSNIKYVRVFPSVVLTPPGGEGDITI